MILRHSSWLTIATSAVVVITLIMLYLDAFGGTAEGARHAIWLVSKSSTGAAANGESQFSSISADGRYVAFRSEASNLVDGDTNSNMDVFVHDRVTGVTEIVSVDSSGNQGIGMSQSPDISANGQIVAFHSTASNLVPDDTNEKGEIFAHDRTTAQTERVSVASNGDQADQGSEDLSIGGNGRYVVFRSAAVLAPGASSLRNPYVRDRLNMTTELLFDPGSGAPSNLSISDDGRFIGFSSDEPLVFGDTNDTSDVFVTCPHWLYHSLC